MAIDQVVSSISFQDLDSRIILPTPAIPMPEVVLPMQGRRWHVVESAPAKLLVAAALEDGIEEEIRFYLDERVSNLYETICRGEMLGLRVDEVIDTARVHPVENFARAQHLSMTTPENVLVQELRRSF